MAAGFFQQEAAASLAAFRLFRLCCVLEFFNIYLLPFILSWLAVHEEQGMDIWRDLRVMNPPGSEGVHKSEMSVTLKSSTSLKILYCSL